MAINCETKKRIIAYFTSIICGPFANDYSLLAYGDCRVWWAKVNEECKDLSGQHLLSVMASVPCIKRLALLPSPRPVSCICFWWRMCSEEIYVSATRLLFVTLLCEHFSRMREPRTEFSWRAVQRATSSCHLSAAAACRALGKFITPAFGAWSLTPLHHSASHVKKKKKCFITKYESEQHFLNHFEIIRCIIQTPLAYLEATHQLKVTQSNKCDSSKTQISWYSV